MALNLKNCETQIANIKLNGEVRSIQVWRFSPSHAWHTVDLKPIVCRFKTGKKLHAPIHPSVVEKEGKFFFPTQSVHNHHSIPIRWNDGQEDSLWTKR